MGAMPRISLTDFVDIVARSGRPKLTKVREVKARGQYDPRADFYKALRDEIVAVHQSGRPRDGLKRLLPGLTDQKKRTLYPILIQGYLRWWGRRSITWFAPPTGVFSESGIEVSVNPELGLVIDAQRYVIKLYFKAEPITKNRIDIVSHLMEIHLRSQVRRGEIFAVLDVRKGRIFTPPVPIPELGALIGAELAYIAALWPRI